MNCPDCNAFFNTVNLINQKRIKDTRKIIKTYKCPGCNTDIYSIITAAPEQYLKTLLISR